MDCPLDRAIVGGNVSLGQSQFIRHRNITDAAAHAGRRINTLRNLRSGEPVRHWFRAFGVLTPADNAANRR